MSDQTNTTLNVAFLHDQLHLGGSVAVSYQTALYFNRHQIRSTFFARSIDRETFDSESDQYRIELLPQGKLMSEEQIDFVIDKIRENHISILFIVTNVKEFPVRIREATGCKIVYWLHSTPFWEIIVKNARRIAQYRNYPKRLLYPLAKQLIKIRYKSSFRRRSRIYLRTLEQCDAYLVLCEEYKTEIARKLPAAAPYVSKIYPILNTIDIAEEIQKDKKNEIIYMGRLAYFDKRVDRIVRIWSNIYDKLPDWSLKIYGSGEEEENLRTQIRRLKVQRVTLEGYTAHPEEIYQNAAVLCLTSNFEGVPLCMIEAQNQGVVPMAFDCVSGMKFITGNGAGILIPPFDEEKYAEELYRLCHNQETLRQMQDTCLKKRLDYRKEVNDQTWNRIFQLLSDTSTPLF